MNSADGSFLPLSSFSQPHFLLISALWAAAASGSPGRILRSRWLWNGAASRGRAHALSCLIRGPSGEAAPAAGLLSRSPFSSMQTLSFRTSSSSSSSGPACSRSSANNRLAVLYYKNENSHPSFTKKVTKNPISDALWARFNPYSFSSECLRRFFTPSDATFTVSKNKGH